MALLLCGCPWTFSFESVRQTAYGMGIGVPASVASFMNNGLRRCSALLVAVRWLGAAPRAEAQVSLFVVTLNPALTSSNPLTWWSQMTSSERQSVGDGATIGAIA